MTAILQRIVGNPRPNYERVLMSDNKPLYKTTIVVWSDFDPNGVSPIDLVNDDGDNEFGRSYISYRNSREMVDPHTDPHWDNTEHFDV
jgi:hypothetical protein